MHASHVAGSQSHCAFAALLCLVSAGTSVGQTPVTVNTDQLRSIGGVTQLDREKYFAYAGTLQAPTNTNIGNLSNLTVSPNGLNAVTGRIATELDQFIAQNLPEDPTRPGFVNPTSLRNRLRGDYRNFVLNGSRYAGIRANPNALIVQSGRYGTFFPSYFYEPGTGVPRVEPYAEFLNTYLDEVIYGQNAFYPNSTERFHVELLNEPDLHFSANFTRQDYVDFHREVALLVKAEHPQVSIGGPSLAVTGFEDNEFGSGNDFSRFEQRVGNLIAGAGTALDFYSIHPYERYDVQNNGSVIRRVNQSPGRVNGQLDLINARDLAVNGRTAPIALTEYGSFNLPNSSGNFGNYPRSEQQWDLSRDIREQLLIYLDRPDVILNATPFVSPRDFRNTLPTNAIGDNVFFEQDASGRWSETILAQTFRAYANVRGEYIGIENGASGDLQTVAFRDGDQVFVLLNNLLDTPQTVDLNVLSSLGGVQSASLDRLFRQGGQNIFVDNQDVTSTFGSLTLNPDEGSVLTITLTGDEAYAFETIDQTFYGLDTVLPLTQPTGRSPAFTIDADVDSSALAATLRLTYSREGFTPGEGFEVFINGESLTVPAGVLGIDDGDFGVQTREVDVPLDLLVDGVNTLQVDFLGNGGFLASSALVVTSDLVVPGDYDGDGLVDQRDYDAWLAAFGVSVPPGTGADGNGDGLVDIADYTVWRDALSTQGTATAVPEPAGAVLLLGAIGVTLRRRDSGRS